MRRVSKLRTTVVVAGFMLAALLVPSAASADWAPKVSIPGTGTGITNLDSVAGPNGATFAYWTRTIGGDEIVQSVSIDADGNPGTVLDLSAPGEDAKSPVAVVAPGDGKATVAWVRSNGTNDVVQTANVSSAGVAGPVTTRSAPGNAFQDAQFPALAVAPDDSVAVTWRWFMGPVWVVQAMTISGAGAAGTVRDISEATTTALGPKVAAIPSNTFRLAWIKADGVQSNVVTTVLAADGTPGDLTSLFPTVGEGATGNPQGLDLGLASDGSGMITWVQFRIVISKDPVTGDDVLDGAQFAAMGSIVSSAGVAGAPTMLSPFKVDITDVNLTYNGSSRAFIDWLADPQEAGPTQTQYTVVTGQGPSALRVLAPDSSGNLNPSIASGVGGFSTIGWTQDTLLPGLTVVNASRMTSGLTLLPPTELSASLKSADQAAVTVDQSGDPTALFYGVDLGDVGSVWMSRFTDPGVSVSPGNLEFGQQLLNVTGASRSAFVVSNGSTSLGISGISITGPDAGDFQLGSSNPCGAEIAPGATCEVKVSYAPASAGTSTAQINVNTAVGTKVISLGGKGVARTRLTLKVKPKNRAQRKGKVRKVTAQVKNAAGLTATGLKLCAYGNKRVVRPKTRCVKISSVGVGKTVKRKFALRLNGRAKKGRKYSVNFQLKSNNANSRRASFKLRLKG